MAIVQLKLGTSFNTLNTLPKPIAFEGISIELSNKFETKNTYSNAKSVAVTGKIKKVITLSYYNVKHSELITYLSYQQAKAWACQLTGFGATDLFKGFVYVDIKDYKPVKADDVTIRYNLEITLYEI